MNFTPLKIKTYTPLKIMTEREHMEKSVSLFIGLLTVEVIIWVVLRLI